MKAKIAIIGGSGVYDPKIFSNAKRVKIKTPFGLPSAPFLIGDFSGRTIVFLARHGEKHSIPPHAVNYRANMWALKKLGVERIISVCTVGSLNAAYEPGEIVIPDQYIDFTKNRHYTFYDGPKVVHVSLADPFCSDLRKLFSEQVGELKLRAHEKGTYLCIEGPRFSTRAESRMFRSFAHIIGMTLVPEVQLARELEICYLSLATVTDYDAWREKPVDTKEILGEMAKNMEKIKKILEKAIPKISEQRLCQCKDAFKDAVV